MKSVLQAAWLLTIAFGNIIVLIVAQFSGLAQVCTKRSRSTCLPKDFPPSSSAALPPPLSSQLHPIFEIPLESELSASSLDDLGQGLKHCHKSAAHFNATLKQCERLVSVAPALFLYGLLWLFFIKRPCGVILKFLSVC